MSGRKRPAADGILPGLESLYAPRPGDGAAFGDRYRPPARFAHGVGHEVARYEPDEAGACEGRLVVVSESRHPVPFFRIATTEADGTTWALGTGSGCEQLAARVAAAVAAGELGVRSPRGRVADTLAALEAISQHAYDDDTPVEDLRADFDRMRQLALDAIAAVEGEA